MRCFRVGAGLVLTAAFFTVLCVAVFAYENEPADFRGIKWGSHIEDLSNMELVLDGGDLKAYAKTGDKMMIEEAALSGIHYIFYKDQFYCVHIEFEGISNFEKIRDAFFDAHGKPQGRQYYDRHFTWPGEKASISLDFDDSTQRGELGYKYLPIEGQVAEDERIRAEEDAG